MKKLFFFLKLQVGPFLESLYYFSCFGILGLVGIVIMKIYRFEVIGMQQQKNMLDGE